MNLNPEIWGPHGWFFLESIILSMPEKLTPKLVPVYKNFFESLQYLLPCQKCRIHYAENLKKHPLSDEIVSQKNSMIKWIIKIHNEVLKSNKKQVRTYDEVIKYYKKAYSNEKSCSLKNTKPDNNIYAIIIIALIILIYISYRNQYI